MTAKAGASLDTNLLWEAIDWLAVETSVSRLQARIVKAVQEKRWNKVKALQRLLTHSVSGKLSAVRRVTENDGKRTGFAPISRTHLKRLIMSQEVCHGNTKKICWGVQAGSGSASSVW